MTIKGRGWGHGVGLCQVGAKGLALAPHNLTCDQILAHYFPGTQLSGEGSVHSGRSRCGDGPSARPQANRRRTGENSPPAYRKCLTRSPQKSPSTSGFGIRGILELQRDRIDLPLGQLELDSTPPHGIALAQPRLHQPLSRSSSVISG